MKKARRRQWTEESVIEEVRRIVVAQCGGEPKDVRHNLHFRDDLQVNALDATHIIVEIEEVFAIEIPDGDASRLLTVDAVMRYVFARVSGNTGAEVVGSRIVDAEAGALGCSPQNIFMRRNMVV